MNEQKLEQLVFEIINHYQRIGGYKSIPHNIDDCVDTRFFKVIEVDKHGSASSQTGFYHNSLTTVPFVNSSIDGQRLELQPLPVAGLYWIRRSQGYDNAPIIAHIHSWGGTKEQLFAFVAK